MAPCLSNDTSFFVYYLQLHHLRHSISPLRSVESTSIVGKCNSIRLTKSITTVQEYNRCRLIHFSGPKCPWQQALCEFSWPKIPHSPGIDYRKSREVHRASKKALQALIRDRYVCYQAADVRTIPQPLTGDRTRAGDATDIQPCKGDAHFTLAKLASLLCVLNGARAVLVRFERKTARRTCQ
jgi:hypothetical protein